MSVRGRRIPTTKVPGWMEPMLATLVESLPDNRGWLFERKLDGYRAIAYRDGASLRLYSRNKLPLDDEFPTIVETLKKLSARRFVIDGEIVAVVGGDAAGFGELQRRTARTPVRYYVFDVLLLGDDDVRPLPLIERKRLLRSIRLAGPLKRTGTRTGDAEQLRAEACAAGWEGLIAKRADSPYRGSRSREWLKLKCTNEQELVIAGYTDPKGSRAGFGALMLGYYEDGRLHYAGEVGTGFDTRALLDLAAKLKPTTIDRSPFSDYPRIKKGQHFVKPKLVAQIAFAEWTHDGKLRHPRFLGIRKDKRPTEVVREKPAG